MRFTIKTDNKIMELIGVSELRHYIAETNKGSLSLMLRKGESQYIFVLDAVPVTEETNKELMALIFPDKDSEMPVTKSVLDTVVVKKPFGIKEETIVSKKTRGRPKKVM